MNLRGTLLIFIVVRKRHKTREFALGHIGNHGIPKADMVVAAAAATAMKRVRRRMSDQAVLIKNGVVIVVPQAAHASSGTVGQLLESRKAKARLAAKQLAPCHRASGLVNHQRGNASAPSIHSFGSFNQRCVCVNGFP